MNMKALLYYGERDIRLEEIPVPSPQFDEVLIKVTHAGISQTQVNEFIEGPFIINANAHPLTGNRMSLIPGHEFGGIIEAVGDSVDRALIGLQVAVLPRFTCGECRYCLNGRENICDQLVYYGLVGHNGGFAEYATINRKNVYPVDNVDMMSFVEPLLVGTHAGRILEKQIDGNRILIMGAGGVGLSVALVLKYYYKANVIVCDFQEERLRITKSIGFETIHTEEIAEQYDVVIDCAGNDPASQQSALLEGLGYLYKGGTLLSIGAYFHAIQIVPTSLTFTETNIMSSFAYDSEDERLLPDVIASIPVDFKALIEEIPLDNIIEEGYYRSEIDKDSFVRIVIRP